MWASFELLRVVCTTDSEFSGIDKLSLPVTTRVVAQARRNRPLTPEPKALNGVRSRERIRVEHAIGHRKPYRVASETYRGHDDRYDETMAVAVVAGLVNLRVYDRIEPRQGSTFSPGSPLFPRRRAEPARPISRRLNPYRATGLQTVLAQTSFGP